MSLVGFLAGPAVPAGAHLHAQTYDRYHVTPPANRSSPAEVAKARAQLVAVERRLRQEYEAASSDYSTAIQAVHDAQASYRDAAKAAAERARTRSDYAAALARVEGVELEIIDRRMSTDPAARSIDADLAVRAMDARLALHEAELRAADEDLDARQAAEQLRAARQALGSAVSQVERQIYTNPEWIAARRALEAAEGHPSR